uniref:Myb-like domain-containing protein n=1 Tax=Solanum lycopersicum TaxID=4081 RepID=A0A3Q7GI03_SOLLC
MTSNSIWTWEEQMKFLEALAICGFDDTLGIWRYLVDVTGKNQEEVKFHFEKVMVEIKNIEASLIHLLKNEEISGGHNNNRDDDEQR